LKLICKDYEISFVSWFLSSEEYENLKELNEEGIKVETMPLVKNILN
jgi:hypothetical protein|tara:strand:- start:323 stop:463 length:141 start_codon:yes stop_codon:yes gene_type:complete